MKTLFIGLLLLLIAIPVRAEDVAADLSVREIEVSAGFTGSKLLVFGAVKKRADVVVVVEGPPVRAKLWTKKRRMGFWINEHPVKFESVPGFYAVASSKPVSAAANEETTARYGLTLAALDLSSLEADKDLGPDAYDGLKQQQQARRLYQENVSGVRLSKGGLFRADFDLPAAVPIGNYTAHIYLLREGRLLASQDVPLVINRVGIEAYVNYLAQESPFAYAFLALACSLGLGGLGAFIFRRKA